MGKPPLLKNQKKKNKIKKEGRRRRQPTKEGRGFGWLPSSSSFLFLYFGFFLFLNEGGLSKFSRDLDQLFLRFLRKFLEFLVILKNSLFRFSRHPTLQHSILNVNTQEFPLGGQGLALQRNPLRISEKILIRIRCSSENLSEEEVDKTRRRRKDKKRHSRADAPSLMTR